MSRSVVLASASWTLFVCLALSLLLISIALFVTAGGGWGVAEEADQEGNQDQEEGDQGG